MENPVDPNKLTPVPDAEFMVTLKVNSASGHDVIVEGINNVIELIKNAVAKKGSWLYVANRRFKFDPTKAEDTTKLHTALRETPSARLTGSLRGGQDSVATAPFDQVKPSKTKKPKKAKKAKAPKAPRVRKSKKTRNSPVADVASNVQSALPLPGANAVQIVLKDTPFTVASKEEIVIGVFTVDKEKGEVCLYPGDQKDNLLKVYQIAVGTLFVKRAELPTS